MSSHPSLPLPGDVYPLAQNSSERTVGGLFIASPGACQWSVAPLSGHRQD